MPIFDKFVVIFFIFFDSPYTLKDSRLGCLIGSQLLNARLTMHCTSTLANQIGFQRMEKRIKKRKIEEKNNIK